MELGNRLTIKSQSPEDQRPVDDGEQLAALGHVQELRREFSLWSIICLQVSLMATWEALTAVAAAALTNGGRPCLFYNYIITFVNTIAVVVSLGEIASIYPTAGGQYHWVYCLAPGIYQATASWFTGWISIGGQLVLAASAAFGAGLQLQGLITLNHESYTPERWQGMLFYWAILIYSLAVNIWGSKILPHTNTAAGIMHVVGFLAIVVVLGVMSPKQSAGYVFATFSNTSGWEKNGVSWLVGLLSTVYPFLGYDAACHLSEELPNPSRNVPLAMVGSVTINGIIGLGYTIMLLFSLGDITPLLESKTGFPFMQLFFDVTASPGGASIMTLCITLIAIAANAAGVTSVSRTAWAFARDRGLPASKFLSEVNPTLKVPVRMVVLVVFLQMLLGLIYLGSETAFNAILSMAIMGMYASYLAPISFMLISRSSASVPRGLRSGRLTLGLRCGLVMNSISVLWLILAIVFSTFPSVMPVTPTNMNYCVAVTMAWVVVGGVYYFLLGGKKRFEGPTVHLS